MLSFAFSFDAPCALRYPKGCLSVWDSNFNHQPLSLGKGELVKEGESVLLLPLGIMMEEAFKAVEILAKNGISAGIFNPRFVKPLDEENIARLANIYPYFVTIEDHIISGGFGSAVGETLNRIGSSTKLKTIGFPDEAIPQGCRNDVLAHYGLSAAGIAETVSTFMGQKS
jgi:1-deoxy-D-xylulose-5-phosphate synthase